MTATAMPTRVVRHPILGFFSGLLLGLGIALLLISFAVIALGTLTPVVVTVAGAVLRPCPCVRRPRSGWARCTRGRPIDQCGGGHRTRPIVRPSNGPRPRSRPGDRGARRRVRLVAALDAARDLPSTHRRVHSVDDDHRADDPGPVVPPSVPRRALAPQTLKVS